MQTQELVCQLKHMPNAKTDVSSHARWISRRCSNYSTSPRSR